MACGFSNTCRAVIVFIWAALTLLKVHVASATNISIHVAASEIERQALLNSGWWKDRIPHNTSDHCGWVGITCDYEGRITDIGLQNSNIKGELGRTIPKEIGSLRNLESLDLSSNNLNGTIPKEIGSLRNLELLDLSSNNLNGTVPKEIGSLRNLKVLDLGSNNLNGTIPKEIGSLRNLEWLELSSNNLNDIVL
ncbi:hypothetical protein CUMW_273950 [Citrus unshiu]|uniref:Disease resistance R13L4/SHOC-2-like LRR domain-containing protein n=1 Tax=Citrus unshiu TaxID=55188 RepID=A0A2H5MZ05_CITUN|nr:hypothetical protein CUMW_273950 [Citrus unshiu]